MLQITFESDGRIRVFAMDDGVTISVTAPVNQLQALLPAATFTAVRDRMAGFLDATLQAPQLRKVN